MPKMMHEFARYVIGFRAVKRGMWEPRHLREVIRYQAGFGGAGARAAGSPVVDEDRDWRRPASLRWDVRGEHDSPLSYATNLGWARTSRAATYDDYPPMR
jgi:hypothetical protein